MRDAGTHREETSAVRHGESSQADDALWGAVEALPVDTTSPAVSAPETVAHTGKAARSAPPGGAGTETPLRQPNVPRLQLQGIQRVLCIGAHREDIALGAGGIIGHLIEASPSVEVWWVVLGAEVPSQARDARRLARLFLRGASKTKVLINGFRDGCMSFHGEQVTEAFEEISEAFSPDLVLTNHDNGHIDHRFVSEITRSTWRDRAILEYESFGRSSVMARPNIYVPLTEGMCKTKVERLLKLAQSGAREPWYSEDVFWSLMRLRGAECGASTRLAEAFHARCLFAG